MKYILHMIMNGLMVLISHQDLIENGNDILITQYNIDLYIDKQI